MNCMPLARGRSPILAAVLAFAALALALAVLVPGGFAHMLASQGTPEGQATPADGAQAGDGPHPAHIHLGTCDELGEVVLPLENVVDPSAGGERSGPASAHAVKTSQSVVDMPLEEIIAGGHAINVHLSSEEIGTYIACGDIGGSVFTDADAGSRTELIIGLGELNDSGHVGIAWLGADGDQTEVSISLIEPDEME